MDQHSGTPFDGIESAHEFLRVLSECVAEAKHEIELDVERESAKGSRRLDALRVASYNLEKLEGHVNKGVRILNDLRSLRRLLFEERTAGAYKLKPPQAARTEIPPSTSSRPSRAAAKRRDLVAA
jgi:hypothetical protein